MRSRFAIAAAALTLGLFAVPALAPAALADGVQPSIHVALTPVGETLRSGFVEDIHANGPNIYATEIYVLNGAKPGTTYQVTLNIYKNDTTCSSSAIVIPPTPTGAITTNAAGNGRGQRVFRPSDVDNSLRGQTHGVIWTVSGSSGVAFKTGCTAVALD